ncbi:MAG: agmatine deiminase family protein, partial [Bacteroidales bacterium]|nr:agmatine deiminase family protein [Bacteroidales bacterium]
VAHIGYFGIPLTLISELSEDVLVYIVCDSGDESSITSSLNGASVNMDNIIYVNAPLDSYWARDYSPWFIEYGANNEVGIVNFPYNRPRPNDNDLPLALGSYFDLEVFGMNLEHTGGNYMTDGMGISASCDLVYEENPGLSESEVDNLVEDYLGITEYHLVQDPLDDYIEHIDCWGKFLDVDKMLVASVPSSDYRYADFEAMADYWANQTSSYGNKFQVYRTAWVVDGNAYTNSLIMNNKVFVAFNTGGAAAYNDAAAAAYEEAMPGYEIIGISYNGWESTDALHCRTHEVPDFETLRILHYPYFDTVDYQTQYVFEADVYSFNNSNNINSVKLFYKINGGNFVEAEMTNAGGDLYNVSIDIFETGDVVSYYIQATDDRPKTETHPFIGSADPHVFVIEDVSNISISTSSYIKAFPNPANDILYFITNKLPEDKYSVEILNQQAQIVIKLNNWDLSTEWKLNGIDISNLNSGIYFIKATSNNSVFSTKFIKL